MKTYNAYISISYDSCDYISAFSPLFSKTVFEEKMYLLSCPVQLSHLLALQLPHENHIINSAQ